MAALLLASMTNNFRNSDDNSMASLVNRWPGKWCWRHCLVRAGGIEVVVSDDLLVVAWSRSFRRLAAFVPVGRMVWACGACVCGGRCAFGRR